MKWFLILLTITMDGGSVNLLSSHETMAECYHGLTEATLFDEPSFGLDQEIICVRVDGEINASGQRSSTSKTE